MTLQKRPPGWFWREVAIPLQKRPPRVVLVGGGNALQFCRGALKRIPPGLKIDPPVFVNRCPSAF